MTPPARSPALSYSDVTMTIGGMVVPVESVVTFDDEPAEPVDLTPIAAEWVCTVDGLDAERLLTFMRRAEKRWRVEARNRRRVGQGARLASKRRAKGWCRAQATTWVRDLHRLNPFIRREGFASAEAADIVESVARQRAERQAAASDPAPRGQGEVRR